MSDVRVDTVVVGAGFAGLAAAEALHAAGRSVVILEARERVGGRARTIAISDGAVDLGATWFWHNEPLVYDYATRLGSPVFPQHVAGDAMFQADQGRQRLSGNPIDAPASRFARGAEDLARRIAAGLPDAIFHFNEPAHAIEVNKSEVLVTTGAARYRADYAICALPPALLAEQITFAPELPSAWRELAESTSVWMGDIVKAVAIYDDAAWREEGLAGSAISYVGPFREFHDHSGPGGRPSAIFAFAPSQLLAQQEKAQIAAAFRAQLEVLFGDAAAQPREVHILDWRREAYTSPQHPARRAGTASYGSPSLRTPLHDRVLVASTETAHGYAGHIEGALMAGQDAARRIIAK
ncbi:MAG TPA: NAD(P)/FAD-dependent oxidoreductase [Arachnia sp.]|nr:NAD(P)/FAD-dependent oxidoreductase [Arachnia sp.]HMT87130.1 NAD(P)/FAD-dependent oxidoreductase [Arachnia sp.]